MSRNDEAEVSAFEAAKGLFFEGIAAVQAKDYVAAEASFRRSLTLNPDRVSVLTNLAAVLVYQERHPEALDTASRAAELDPSNVEALLIVARCQVRAEHRREALEALDRVLALRPGDADSWLSRATLLVQEFRFVDAIAAYEKALELRPADAMPYVASDLAHLRMRICDWRHLAADRDALRAAVADGRPWSTAFTLLSLSDDPALQLAAARQWVNDQHPARPPRWTGERYGHDRIRLAYLSPDFREHPVALLTAGLFEHHDRRRFQTIAISVGRDDGGAMRPRIAAAFERFHDMRGVSDGDIAQWVRAHEVDILVDLSGQTEGSRLGVLAERPAPVQVTYLGYPGTSGAAYVDYVIADAFVAPVGSEGGYSEKLIRLPDCFQANDDKRPAAVVAPARFAVGLPERGFVFCSFNNTYKLNPDFFDVWMRLLHAVPSSVLWLVAEEAEARAALRQEAQNRGVEPGRLVFANRVTYPEHLSRHRLADLFLDTLPFNAGTTASDALWAGLPVVTCAGRSFAARMAGSLLRAVGHPELITQSLADYEALALRLATTPAALAALRARLLQRRVTAPLFDTARFCRNLEAAYVALWRHAEEGLPPQHVALPAV
jgi:protein O-GlcNAc transferase